MMLLWAAVAFYGLAGVLYAAFLLGPRAAAPIARILLGAGLACHTAEIARRGIAGIHPVSSAGDAIGFVTWVMVVVYLVVQRRRRLFAVGALVAPTAALLVVIAYLFPEAAPGVTASLGVLGRVHILLAITGAASFAFATALAVFYLVQERQLKRHRIGRAVQRGAALETLDYLMHRTVQVGFPVFTLALLTGILWTVRRADTVQVQNILGTVAWAVFGSLLLARYVAGWRGRRAAVLTIIGFLATASVFGIYLTRGMS